MSRTALFSTYRRVARNVRLVDIVPRATLRSAPARARLAATRQTIQCPTRAACAAFSTCQARGKGIMPDTDSPAQEAEKSETVLAPAELTEDQYHRLADEYLEDILVKFEDLQDQREGLDIEYAAGVMTLSVAETGTYVVNKQPPNKQIWLSSPISGPKRYDWCVIGDGQNDKEGTATGAWVYTRDGSTVNQLFHAELGVDLDTPLDDAA